MKFLNYDRTKAVNYAIKWAKSRNPAYYDFTNIGGDCTNFVSQCICAGTDVMNYTPIIGWYYLSSQNRSASWTDVDYLYNFLTKNIVLNKVGNGSGPFAEEVTADSIMLGDVIQLANTPSDYTHSLIVVGFKGTTPLVASHSYDTLFKPINAYSQPFKRYLHIIGARGLE